MVVQEDAALTVLVGGPFGFPVDDVVHAFAVEDVAAACDVSDH